MAGNVDHGCVVPLSCGSPGPAPRPPPPLRVVAAGLSQPSGSRLTPCGALCPQPRAVPGPHLGRHRRRLRHGRRGRRHLALRQGGVQLAKGPPKPGAGRLLGACRLAHVAWPYWLQLESRHTAGQLCCNTSHATVVAALPLLGGTDDALPSPQPRRQLRGVGRLVQRVRLHAGRRPQKGVCCCCAVDTEAQI